MMDDLSLFEKFLEVLQLKLNHLKTISKVTFIALLLHAYSLNSLERYGHPINSFDHSNSVHFPILSYANAFNESLFVDRSKVCPNI